MLCSTSLSAWNLNTLRVNAVGHSLSKGPCVLFDEVKLELESALGSTKREVLHNLCKALDGASLECKIVLCV